MLRVSSIISNVPEHVKNWSTWDLTKTLSTICGSSTASDNVTVVKLNTLLPDKSTASTNNDVTFTATTLPSDYGNLITWSGGGIPSIQNGGLQFTTKWSSVGPKTVTASCGNDIPASVDITDNISVSITTPSSFPAYVNSGDYLQLDCTPLGSTGGDYSWSALPGTCTISSSTAKNPTFSSNTTGNYTVQVVFTDTASGTQAIDTKYPITVVDISVVIDTPSDFPAYVDVDKPIQLGCTVSGSTGGDYTWSASGPGNVTFSQGPGDEDPTFSADKPGSYSVNVEFKDSDSDITVYSSSITITVVKFAVEISCPDLIAIGSTAYATATTSPPGRTVTWSIIGDGRGAAIDSSTGAIMTGTPESSTGGPVKIRATDSEFPEVYDDDYFILFGVRVTEPPKANPAYVALDEDLPLDCQPLFLDPSVLDPLYFPGSGYNWTQDSGSGVVTFSPGPGMKNPAFSADQPGNYTVKVNSRILNVIAGLDVTASDTSGIITVVEIEKIQYNDPDTGYTDISGTLYVNEGTTVTFKAIKDPSSASWPSGKPVWSGTSGASGTGETKQVTFDTLSINTSDYKTVTAECGNIITINVIVYSFQGIISPDVIFDGRTYNTFGVEETCTLYHQIYPTGITGLPLKWKVHSGVGSISDLGTTYDAGAIAGDVTLKLELESGPSKGRHYLYARTVVAPTAIFIRHRTKTGIWHRKNYHSCVIKMEVFLDPKNVSFTNIEFREGSSTPAVCTGILSRYDGDKHPIGDWFVPSNPNITTGCFVEEDTVGLNVPDPGVLGEWGTWSQFFIDLEYRGYDEEERDMGDIEFVGEIETGGDTKIKKGLVGWIKAHLTDDSNFIF